MKTEANESDIEKIKKKVKMKRMKCKWHQTTKKYSNHGNVIKN